MIKEEFREIDIPGYMVSNLGNIRSMKSSRGITPYANKDGYLMVKLRDSSNGQKQEGRLLHRLVAMAFVDGYEEGLEVDHKDQNRTNNASDNLRWVDRLTQQRNTTSNVYVSFNGESHILKDICAKFNSPTLYINVLSRVNRGKGSHQSVFDASIRGLIYGN